MPERLPLVLLHGWGFDRRIWDELLPFLSPYVEVITLDLPGFGETTAADDLLSQLPERCVLLGWSLGGMLATQMAIEHPQRVAGLITVGSNLKWVAEGEWPGAAPDNFAAFFENLAQNFAGTQQHFCGVIARGDKNEKQLARVLRQKLSGAPPEVFLQGLRLLDSIDNREGFTSINVPGLHIFGEQDAMVPRVVAQHMQQHIQQRNPSQQTMIIPGTAHAPFLSQPQFFASTVLEWLARLPYRLDKKQVAQSFSKAALSYDQAAHLQRRIGEKLLSYLPMDIPAQVLDVGCGTGVFTAQLQLENPESQVTGFDLAEGMLRVLKMRDPSVPLICGDAENLPFADGGIHLLFSNLAIQWCQDYPRLFAEWRRVLADQGECIVSTFVDGTLQELKEAWQQVDDLVHINHFVSADELCQYARALGFSSVECEVQTETVYYRSVSGLMRELRDVGAHNLNAGRRSGLTGKSRLLKLARAYESRRQQQMLPATYRVAYLVLKK